MFGGPATHRKSFCSPFLARMPWVAVNRWPGTLIMGISALAGPSWGCSVTGARGLIRGVQGVMVLVASLTCADLPRRRAKVWKGRRVRQARACCRAPGALDSPHVSLYPGYTITTPPSIKPCLAILDLPNTCLICPIC